MRSYGTSGSAAASRGKPRPQRTPCSPRMVVLQVVAPGEIGGLERVAQALASGLRGLGHDVHVAVMLDAPGAHPFLAGLDHSGIPTHPLVLPGRAYLRERRAVAGLCRSLRPDVVHTHGYRPDVVDAGVARGLGIPIVTTVHGFTGGGWKNHGYEWLQCRAFRRFDAVVAGSPPPGAPLAGGGGPPGRPPRPPDPGAPSQPPPPPP